ncbi:hypothetical protein OTU49_005120, partial [Cherax quadricarinatus]
VDQCGGPLGWTSVWTSVVDQCGGPVEGLSHSSTSLLMADTFPHLYQHLTHLTHLPAPQLTHFAPAPQLTHFAPVPAPQLTHLAHVPVPKLTHLSIPAAQLTHLTHISNTLMEENKATQ